MSGCGCVACPVPISWVERHNVEELSGHADRGGDSAVNTRGSAVNTHSVEQRYQRRSQPRPALAGVGFETVVDKLLVLAIVRDRSLDRLERQPVVVGDPRDVTMDSFEIPHERPNAHPEPTDPRVRETRAIGVAFDVLVDQVLGIIPRECESLR